MNTITVEKVRITDTEVWIRTTDGRDACEKFSDYPQEEKQQSYINRTPET